MQRLEEVLRQSYVFFGAGFVVDVERYSEVVEIFLIDLVPAFDEFLWVFSFFFSFDQNGGAEVVCCAYVYGVVAFESAVSDKYVCWKICRGNMS